MATELDIIKAQYDANVAKAELDAGGEEKDRNKLGLNLLDNLNASLLSGLAMKEGTEAVKDMFDKRTDVEKANDALLKAQAEFDKTTTNPEETVTPAVTETNVTVSEYEESVLMKTVDGDGQVSNNPFKTQISHKWGFTSMEPSK
tara:strand:- start:17340 stop:17774 length:435 start_codon:yes stop_codon:yes gene_type:complete